jgi:hypothetical protein
MLWFIIYIASLLTAFLDSADAEEGVASQYGRESGHRVACGGERQSNHYRSRTVRARARDRSYAGRGEGDWDEWHRIGVGQQGIANTPGFMEFHGHTFVASTHLGRPASGRTLRRGRGNAGLSKKRLRFLETRLAPTGSQNSWRCN